MFLIIVVCMIIALIHSAPFYDEVLQNVSVTGGAVISSSTRVVASHLVFLGLYYTCWSFMQHLYWCHLTRNIGGAL